MNRQAKSTVSFFIVLSLIIGFFTYGSQKVYAGENLVLNHDFEKPLMADNKISDWVLIPELPAEATQVKLTSELKHSGENSLYIEDNSTTQPIGIKTTPINIEGNQKYKASAFIYVKLASVRMYLKYYDSKGVFISDESILENTKETWTETVLEVTTPENARTAEIWFYMGIAGVSSAFIDNVNLEVVEAVESKDLELSYGEPVDFGDAVQVPLSQGAAYSYNETTNRNEQYFGINGSPATFYAVDAESGEKIYSQTLPGVDVIWAITRGSDGNIYFAGTNNGILYSYLPSEKKIVQYGPIVGQVFIWDMKASDDGKIYFGTYKKGASGKVFEFDIESKTITDLGIMKEGSEYVRGIGVTDQYIYAGVGGIVGSIVRVNRETMEKEYISVPNPPAIMAEIKVYGGKIFASSGSVLYIMDEITLEVLQTMKFDGKISSPSPYDENKIYFKAEKTKLFEYDIETNLFTVITGIPELPTTAFKNLEWITLQDSEKEGETVLAAMAAYTDSIFFDPRDNWFDIHYPNVQAQGVLVQSMEISPTGNLYIGGYMRGMSVFNTEIEKYTLNVPTFHQPEGIGFIGNNAYIGTYGGAVIYKHNPDKLFNYREFIAGNPGVVLDIEEEQDRPFVMHEHDEKLYIGTFPGYGQLGGALTIYEENEDGSMKNAKTYRNIVDNQSIIGIAISDTKVYLSTTVDGGLGTVPTETMAKVVIFDESTGQIVKETIPKIPGIDAPIKFIGSISMGPDGNLWAATGIDGTIFAMDPETLEVVKSVRLFAGAVQNSGFRPYYIRWDDNGILYTTVGKKVTAIDISTMNYKVLIDETVNLMTLDKAGNIYYAAGTKLMKLPIAIHKVSLELEKTSINIDETSKLSVSVLDHIGNDIAYDETKLKFEISNDTVLRIQEGTIVPLKPGVAVIKAILETAAGVIESESIEVRVTDYITGLTLKKDKIKLKIDEKIVINAIFEPLIPENTKLVYQSTNPSVAIVSEDGGVKGVGAGEATIIIKSAFGRGYVELHVIVKDKILSPKR